MATSFTPVSSLLGGVLIGLAAVLLLVTNGRIAGISGIARQLLPQTTFKAAYAPAFVLGLVLALPAYLFISGEAPAASMSGSTPLLAIAGLLVGVGAGFGNGCTSGHGVCGIARLSVRSLVATVVFILTAVCTVYVLRHL